jgi:16S rRNA A1518/A1519 N6-dimethyltransferase RsmA/KsgA/DIM1 with predicted DNA glycosylase/AP lyase activity
MEQPGMHFIVTLFYAAPFALFLLLAIWSIKNGIGPNPSSPKQIKAILSQIDPNSSGLILELGSGWGTLAIALARRFKNYQVIGYESSPIPYLVSKLLNGFYRWPNLRFKRQNFFKVPLNDASVIVCYLYRGAMGKLKQKFDQELRTGTRIISNTFSLPESTPDAVVQVEDLFRTKIYSYTM